MGRIKIRNYPSREWMTELFNNYFVAHNDEIVQLVLNTFGFNTVEEMQEAEYRGYFGLDCGWITLKPKNKDHAHEWFLDNNRIDSKMYISNPLYNTQSTTIKKIMIDKAVEDLGLTNTFYVGVRLD